MKKKLTAAERAKRNADTLRGRLNRLVIGARASAKNKNYEFEITLFDVALAWKRQGGLCAYTGWAMSTETKNPRLVSLDRRDSSVGYTPTNIQLACWSANRAKSTMSETEFIELCAAVNSHSNLL